MGSGKQSSHHLPTISNTMGAVFLLLCLVMSTSIDLGSSERCLPPPCIGGTGAAADASLRSRSSGIAGTSNLTIEKQKPTCECSSFERAPGLGACKSKYKYKYWCYLKENQTGCRDKTYSRSTGMYWSWSACYQSWMLCFILCKTFL